jgi:hypothetical protein
LQNFNIDRIKDNCAIRMDVKTALEDLESSLPRSLMTRRFEISLILHRHTPLTYVPLVSSGEVIQAMFIWTSVMMAITLASSDELILDTHCRERMSLGKQSPKTARDVEECMQFDIMAQRFAASGRHKDSSAVGTWLTCQYGVKLWPIVSQMTDAQWSEFLAKGEDWIPSQDHSVPVVAVFPGDTLLMLPGNHNVHTPITLEDCEMVGECSGIPERWSKL